MPTRHSNKDRTDSDIYWDQTANPEIDQSLDWILIWKRRNIILIENESFLIELKNSEKVTIWNVWLGAAEHREQQLQQTENRDGEHRRKIEETETRCIWRDSQRHSNSLNRLIKSFAFRMLRIHETQFLIDWISYFK